ncbi:peroxiredoxin family protein [Thermodesulfobacteriota bacterium]
MVNLMRTLMAQSATTNEESDSWCVREQIFLIEGDQRRCENRPLTTEWPKSPIGRAPSTFMRIAAALLLVLTFSASAGAVKVGDEAPPFVATTLDGEKINTEDLKNKKSMFLVFWATWCPYCKTSVGKLRQVYETYEKKGMVFLAINPGINDPIRRVKRFVDLFRVTYPVVYDKGARITKRYNIRGAPTIVMVDREGIVRFRGAKIPKDLSKRFSKLMK